MQNYVSKFLDLYESAINALVKKGIKREVIDFRSEYKKPRQPTAAFSEFLINRQLGDWAETLLRVEINSKLKRFKALRYGASGRLIVGDPNFPKFFNTYHKEIKEIGKRPDLLFFKEEFIRKLNLPDDISDLTTTYLTELSKEAVAAMEVRSSRYYAAIYEKSTGKKQSFTPKLEDLPVLTRWIFLHAVPCFYSQVFLDEIYMISFERVLEIIENTGDEYLRSMEKNQRKWTFYIPVSEGVLIGKVKENPSWEAKLHILPDGRVIPYVFPKGGKMDINIDMLMKELKLD
jgi:hypothetical protein